MTTTLAFVFVAANVIGLAILVALAFYQDRREARMEAEIAAIRSEMADRDADDVDREIIEIEQSEAIGNHEKRLNGLNTRLERLERRTDRCHGRKPVEADSQWAD